MIPTTTILPNDVLDALLPLHLKLNEHAQIDHVGSALSKLIPEPLLGRSFFEFFEIERPRVPLGTDDLCQFTGRKLILSLINGRARRMPAMCHELPNGGFMLNLALGPGFHKIFEAGHLTAADLAATDSTLDMIYLIEVQNLVLQASRGLNSRLHGQRDNAEEMARTDALTGLNNRRELNRFFDEMRMRQQDHFAVILLDLDFFKEINDTHGHAAGDHVLIEVAKRLRSVTRKRDFIARLGGDEFVILLPEIGTKDDLRKFCNRAIDHISEPIFYGEETCKIGVSMGLKIFKPSEHLELENVMMSTDTALYHAKQTGRGQVSFYSE